MIYKLVYKASYQIKGKMMEMNVEKRKVYLNRVSLPASWCRFHNSKEVEVIWNNIIVTFPEDAPKREKKRLAKAIIG